MNRNVLAIVITSLLAANVANAAEIYNKDGNKIHLTGKVEANYKFRDKEAKKWIYEQPQSGKGANQNNEDNTFVRIGFKGETQINSQLTGYATFEHQYGEGSTSSDSKEIDGTRLSYVGLKYANLGSLDFGRNNGIVGIIRDFTDNAAMFGGDGFGGGADIFLTGRASSLATYTNNDFFGYVPGLTSYLQYQAKNSSSQNIQEIHGDGFALTTTYEHEATGLGFGATYSKSDRATKQLVLQDNGSNAEIWGIATKYDANNIYAAISWAQTNNMITAKQVGTAFLQSSGERSEYPLGSLFADKTRGLEALFNYTFDLGNESSVTPSIVYNQTRARNLYMEKPFLKGFTRSNAYLTKYVGLGVKYQFNKNIDTAFGYKINLIDENNPYTQQARLDIDDQIEMRLTYSF